jgi:hypothetical protein
MLILRSLATVGIISRLVRGFCSCSHKIAVILYFLCLHGDSDLFDKCSAFFAACCL